MSIQTRHQTQIALCAALACTVLSSGCSSVGNALSGDKVDYRTSGAQTVKLDVPPDLTQLAKEGDEVWEGLARTYPGDPHAQLEGWVKYVERILTDSGDRGCAIANAAVELRESGHPARQIIDDYKTRKRGRLVGLFRDADYADPELLADEVFLLFEGARISIQCCSNASGPASRVVGMLRSLLSEHAPKR